MLGGRGPRRIGFLDSTIAVKLWCPVLRGKLRGVGPRQVGTLSFVEAMQETARRQETILTESCGFAHCPLLVFFAACCAYGLGSKLPAAPSIRNSRQMAAIQTEEVMHFSLLEKKTFLEFVPSQADHLRRSASLPVLSSEANNPQLGTLDKPVPKLAWVPVREHISECIESDSSPGAESMLESCTAWPLASTHGGSEESLLTFFVDDSMHGSSWLDEDTAHDGKGPETGRQISAAGPMPASPRSAASDESATAAGSTWQASVSVGSALHEAKLCKPCAWYWRPGSCTRGADCLHCHLCLDGELTKRRCKNRKLAKLHKKQSKAASRGTKCTP